MKTLLEFEKPIAELEDKLVEMRKLALENNVDVTATVASLTDKIGELKKETFSNLTRWQRVQLSRHPDRPYTFDYIEHLCEEFIEIDPEYCLRQKPGKKKFIEFMTPLISCLLGMRSVNHFNSRLTFKM
jgi:acetyl-CoA carboxylase carboxyl transferase subunit alpha